MPAGRTGPAYGDLRNVMLANGIKIGEGGWSFTEGEAEVRRPMKRRTLEFLETGSGPCYPGVLTDKCSLHPVARLIRE